MRLTILGSGTAVPHPTRTSAAHWVEIVLVHLYPEWDGIDLEGEARKLWIGQTIEGRDGMVIEI